MAVGRAVITNDVHRLATAHFDVHAANDGLVRYIERPESAGSDKAGGDTP